MSTRHGNRVLLVTCVCLALAATAAAEPASPGGGLARIPRMAVVFESTAEELPRAAIRAAIAEELGITLEEDLDGADAVLTVAVEEEEGRLSLSYRLHGVTVDRAIPEPRPEDIPRVIALLAGNVVRNEALDLLARTAPRPPEPPRVTASAPAPALAPAAPLRPPRLLLTAAVGTGYGWARGPLDVNRTDRAGRRLYLAGRRTPAGVLHLAPEIGYHLRERLVASVQLRLQLVTGTTEVLDAACPGGVCRPARTALAALARLAWLLNVSPRARALFSIGVGAGRIRHVVDVTSLQDCGADRRTQCTDSVAGGPLLLGPGAAVHFALGERLSAVAGTGVLVGWPVSTVTVEATVGLAWRPR